MEPIGSAIGDLAHLKCISYLGICPKSDPKMRLKAKKMNTEGESAYPPSLKLHCQHGSKPRYISHIDTNHTVNHNSWISGVYSVPFRMFFSHVAWYGLEGWESGHVEQQALILLVLCIVQRDDTVDTLERVRSHQAVLQYQCMHLYHCPTE